MKDRLVFFQMQEPADLCGSRDSFNPLISSFDLDTVMISQYPEERSVFKLPCCDPGKVNISYITDIVEDGNIIKKPDPFHINTTRFLFQLRQWKHKIMGPRHQHRFHYDLCFQVSVPNC